MTADLPLSVRTIAAGLGDLFVREGGWPRPKAIALATRTAVGTYNACRLQWADDAKAEAHAVIGLEELIQHFRSEIAKRAQKDVPISGKQARDEMARRLRDTSAMDVDTALEIATSAAERWDERQ